MKVEKQLIGMPIVLCASPADFWVRLRGGIGMSFDEFREQLFVSERDGESFKLIYKNTAYVVPLAAIPPFLNKYGRPASKMTDAELNKIYLEKIAELESVIKARAGAAISESLRSPDQGLPEVGPDLTEEQLKEVPVEPLFDGPSDDELEKETEAYEKENAAVVAAHRAQGIPTEPNGPAPGLKPQSFSEIQKDLAAEIKAKGLSPVKINRLHQTEPL